MCGIAGIADPGGIDRKAVRGRLARALDRMARRGPDGEGVWSDDRCALGHRRLAIVDLSPAGAQPMRRDGLAITFNGMIYNFRALRVELERTGARFSTTSDTEVLLVGWRTWGAGLLSRIEGMFAFALWDERTRELVLARDRFGKKPLHYVQAGKALAFASDLIALQRLTGTRGEVDPASLRLYFALRYLPEPFSILAGHGKVPPGHLLRFSGGAPKIDRWHDPAAERPEAFTDGRSGCR